LSNWDLAAVQAADRTDELAHFRGRFELPDEVIYLDGNSLGPLPVGVRERIAELIDNEWRNSLIRSWNAHDWGDLPFEIGRKIAEMIGAEADEVVCVDSTSVNLFKNLSTALQLRPDRKVIATPEGNFPTDIYIAEGLTKQLGGDYSVRLIDHEDPIAGIDDDVAVVLLTQTDYRTGYKLDMATITQAIHDKGAFVVWDLAHSAGAFPVDLNAAKADFAVGCGYKYLNGGPGAPAFLYVAKRHQNLVEQPLAGWHGHAEPFAFESHYRPADGILRNVCGTSPILSMASLNVALDAFEGVDMQAVQKKSQALCEMFIDLVENRCGDFGFTLATTRDAERRGSQISFHHENGYPIMQALIAQGVIGDFRAPDILRFGFTPLYLGFEDVWNAVEILLQIMTSRGWDQEQFHIRAAVT
jgi:kynureninase